MAPWIVDGDDLTVAPALNTFQVNGITETPRMNAPIVDTTFSGEAVGGQIVGVAAGMPSSPTQC